MPFALTRAVPSDFSAAVTAAPLDTPLDPDLAAAQHADYVKALSDGGYEVETLPALSGFPDSVFVEDAALVFNELAILTRPGAPSRRSEPGMLRAALAKHRPVVDLGEGSLDGGDVMTVGTKVYVGLSERTDHRGVAALASIVEPIGLEVVALPVESGLHLKSAASVLGTTVVTAGDPQAFAETDVVALQNVPGVAANVVGLPDGRVLVSHASTAHALGDRGIEAVLIDVSELQRADGALTCLSLRSE